VINSSLAIARNIYLQLFCAGKGGFIAPFAVKHYLQFTFTVDWLLTGMLQ
jgi:hypothetical protein